MSNARARRFDGDLTRVRPRSLRRCLLAGMAASVLLASAAAVSLGRAVAPSCGTHAGGSSTTCPGGHFVAVCGLQLCLGGRSLVVDGATAYGTYADPTAEVALAKAAGLNVLELVEFDAAYHDLSAVESQATWRRVDRFIATAHATGMRVILNLSEYGQALAAAGRVATTVDWGPYLRFIADRVNGVTHVRYRDDPTIALVQLYAEAQPPRGGTGASTAGTSSQLTSFYRRSLAEWKALAPSILVSTGGLSYINEPDSGIDWRRIVADPNDATCDVEVNSQNDLNVSVPAVSSYCERMGKPWFLAAWSSCYGDPASGYDYYPDDAAMARHARAMYRLAQGGKPAATRALGTVFWNLANTPVVRGTCSISRGFPMAFATVRSANEPGMT